MTPSRTSARLAALAAALLLGFVSAPASASPPSDAAKSQLQAGADGSTPLHWAVFHGDTAEVERLLRAGADVSAATVYGVTPMQLAAEVADVAIMKLLLDAGADVESPNAEGQTALMAVARTGNVEAAKLLVSRGANVNARETWGGQSALMWAAARRHPEMMRFLLSKGADIDARSAVRDYQRRITAEGRAKDLNTGGLTPLLYAARENCIECVKVLIERGADIDLPDPDGFAPLTIAMLNNNWDIARLLIEAGADVNQWDIYGQSPLHVAVEMAYVGGGFGGFGGGGGRRAPFDPPNETSGAEVVRMLLERGANPNQQMFFRAPRGSGVSAGSRGTTPFHRACASGDVELIRLMLQHGADVRLHQADGESPMMMVLGSRRVSQDQAVEALRVLYEAGADVNAMAVGHHLKRTRGGTALHYAVRAGWPKAIAELVKFGIDVNARDPDGLTALDYAMSRGYVPFLQQRQPPRLDLAKLLRELGATVELEKTPDWPPVGPPIGYEATIWPL